MNAENHDHELLRLEDPGIIPFNIGIAPTEPRKPVIMQESLSVPIRSIQDEIAEAVELVNKVYKTPLTWPIYIAWRKTKCKPRNLARHLEPGDAILDNEPEFRDTFPKQEWIEEIDQATLELVGEVAELGELFEDNGPGTYYGDKRLKLIDECGDIFFCANWAMDAWSVNPLAAIDSIELIDVSKADAIQMFARVIREIAPEDSFKNENFLSGLAAVTYKQISVMQTSTGLTANSFKKLKFQRRKQDYDVQIDRIMTALAAANVILVLANSSVEEALRSNIKKLDARFPLGYQPGVGGGIRTGEGK
jgi:hypothetical protein